MNDWIKDFRKMCAWGLTASGTVLNSQFNLWNPVHYLFVPPLIRNWCCTVGGKGAGCSVVGWDTMLQAGRSRVRFPIRSFIGFFNWSNPSRRTMTLWSTQPLTIVNTRNLPGGKGWPARKAWQPYRHLWADCLENVGASTSHNRVGLVQG
jgi:hypothetical protein